MINRTRQYGFTILEVIIVFTMATIILVSALQLYQRTVISTMQLRERTAQATALNFCLDKMVTEITDAVTSKAVIEVVDTDGMKNLSGIRLTEYESDTSDVIIRELEWMVSADENDGYSIYRKDYNILDEEVDDMYYPICDRIAAFDVQLLNSEGLDDPNATAALMEFNVRSYINDNSDKTFAAARTFCLRRNEPLGVPDLDALQSQLDDIAESRGRGTTTSTTQTSEFSSPNNNGQGGGPTTGPNPNQPNPNPNPRQPNRPAR